MIFDFGGHQDTSNTYKRIRIDVGKYYFWKPHNFGIDNLENARKDGGRKFMEINMK